MALSGQALGVRGRGTKSNSAVIANLAQTADQPWDWKELERRYMAGKLSSEEVAAAVDHLIDHLNAKPGKGDSPITWPKDFLTLMDSAGEISPEQFDRLREF